MGIRLSTTTAACVSQRVDETANAVVDVLAGALPQSRARLALAANARRIGVLMGTHQQDVAVMHLRDAEAPFLAKPPFADIRGLGRRIIVYRSEFAARLALLMAQALVRNGEALGTPAHAPAGATPVHPGSCKLFAGEGISA
jgi:hypothetical protein